MHRHRWNTSDPLANGTSRGRQLRAVQQLPYLSELWKCCLPCLDQSWTDRKPGDRTHCVESAVPDLRKERRLPGSAWHQVPWCRCIPNFWSDRCPDHQGADLTQQPAVIGAVDQTFSTGGHVKW